MEGKDFKRSPLNGVAHSGVQGLEFSARGDRDFHGLSNRTEFQRQR